MSKPPNFNRLARFYRSMERLPFGPWLSRSRTAFLGELGSRRTALVLGDGDGRFTARLLEEDGLVLVDAVDASSAMLAALIRNAGVRSSRVRLHFADARFWKPVSSHYDLIVTHFFLDCLTTSEVKALAARLRTCVNPGALWLVSEFAIPEGRFGQLVARPAIFLLYMAFRLLTGLKVHRLPNHHDGLTEAGFILKQQRSWLGGLLVSELWSVKPPDAAMPPRLV